MKAYIISRFLIGGAAAALGACGGGGGGEVASIPPAPVAPVAPPPTPTAPVVPPPVPAGPIGLVSDAPFKVVGAYEKGDGSLAAGADLVQFAYSAATNSYTISLPDYQSGQLLTKSGNGSFQPGSTTWSSLTSTWNEVTAGSSTSVQPVYVTLGWPASSGYKYSGTGSWIPKGSTTGALSIGVFAYGIPTAIGNVPTLGAATYTGSISGQDSLGIGIFGSVTLNFDFTAGTLSGAMQPAFATWDPTPIGTYTFRDTVYSAGSTSFSGAFRVDGAPVPSSFQGSFNGPQAAELMAHWTAPFVFPGTGQTGTMSGIWVAKRP